jgi:hypothetical protein
MRDGFNLGITNLAEDTPMSTNVAPLTLQFKTPPRKRHTWPAIYVDKKMALPLPKDRPASDRAVAKGDLYD